MKLVVSFALMVLLMLSCSLKRRDSTSNVPINVAAPSPTVAPVPPTAGKAQIARYNLQLENRDGRCVLSYEGRGLKGVIDEGLQAPCEFARKWPTDAVATYTFTYRGVTKTVVIIIGGPADTAHADKWMPNGCGTSTQDISLRSKSVMASPVWGPNFTACPSVGLDRVFFGADSV